MAPLSKTQRNNIVKNYSSVMNSACKKIENLNPEVYVYSLEDKQLQVLKPLPVTTMVVENHKLVKQGTAGEYPVAQVFEEEDIQFCADINTTIKQFKKNRPSSSFVLFKAEGIVGSVVFIKNKKQRASNKGF